MGHLLSLSHDATSAPSLLAGIDARLRIITAVIFGVVTVALSSLWALGAALALALVLLWLSHLPMRQTLRRMAMVDGFILFMILTLPFTMKGDVMFTLLGYDASWQGFYRAIDIALTANAVILMVMTLVGTLDPVTLGHALHRLRVPETLVHMLMFTIRYIEVLREEHRRLRNAMKVRGFRPKTNLHTYKSYGYLIGMLLVRAIERSERVLGAMKCRGFSGRFLLLWEPRIGANDYAFAAAAVIAMLMLIGIECQWL